MERTVYHLNNVPTARSSALDSCLLALRDGCATFSLSPEEINKERGVINEEWRQRKFGHGTHATTQSPAPLPQQFDTLGAPQ